MDRSNDIYQKVTDQIIAELENGNVPWIRPWRDGEPPFPINALSGRPYHGINVPLLWNSADKQSFASDRWLTFHQVSALGGQVRRGGEILSGGVVSAAHTGRDRCTRQAVAG